MRILLTSSGITNTSIKQAFLELIGRPVSEVKLAFIPTAANVVEDTAWVEEDLQNLRSTGVDSIEEVDISEGEKEGWLPKIEDADVIWFEGGNTYYLLSWVRKSGLGRELPRLLGTKVYVGVSAGSIIAGPDVSLNEAIFPGEERFDLEGWVGLDLVPFAVVPHLNSPHFPNDRIEKARDFSKTVSYPLYAIDDETAIVVSDGGVKIVSEGKWEKFN